MKFFLKAKLSTNLESPKQEFFCLNSNTECDFEDKFELDPLGIDEIQYTQLDLNKGVMHNYWIELEDAGGK